MPSTTSALGDGFLRAWDAVLRRDRVIACAPIILAMQVVLFVFTVAGAYGFLGPLERPTSTDFTSFYAAGTLADSGHPELTYDLQAHYRAEEAATRPGIEYKYFYYPPTFLFVCAAVAKLPYFWSFIVFEAASCFLYLAVIRAILAERSWDVLIPFLACPAIYWTFGLGQNALITAALFGGATLLVDRRPIVSGILFGALCYKPHLALLVPVGLAAGRHYRAFLSALGSVVLLCVASLAVFGWATWSAFLHQAATSPATYESGRIMLNAFASPFGGLLLLRSPLMVNYAIQAFVTLGAAAVVWLVWRRRDALPVRAAVLLAATLVAVPVIFLYDLMLATVAVAWLLRADRSVPLSLSEKSILALLFAALLVSRTSFCWDWPVIPAIALAFSGLVVFHATRVRGAPVAAAVEG
jgi:alpha-1,2-mannosyltransferase